MHAKSTHGKSCDVEPSQNHASQSMKFQVLAVLLQNGIPNVSNEDTFRLETNGKLLCMSME